MAGRRLHYLVLAIIIVTALVSPPHSSAKGIVVAPSNAANIQIQATCLYKDAEGRELGTSSEIVTIIIRSVTLFLVTPSETESSAQVLPHQEFTRLFQVCNGGNSIEQVVISNANVPSPAQIVSLHFDTDNSGSLSANDQEIRVGETLSPGLQPSQCIGVLAVINSEDFPVRANLLIRLTARSTNVDAANGIQQTTGQIVNVVGYGPRLTGSDDAAPLLLVSDKPQATVTSSQTFTYTVRVRNSGDTTALGLSYVDDLIEGLEYVPGTLKLNGRLLSDASDTDEGSIVGSRIKVDVASLASNQELQIESQCRVVGGVIHGQGLSNYAIISGQNFAPIKTTEAVVIVDPYGVVFAARSSDATPIPSATVTLLADVSSNTPLTIPPDLGFYPNTKNSNPNVADPKGSYSFALAPEQYGTPEVPATYYMRATASGFLTRMLKVSLSPTKAGLFQATVSAVDGQPITESGGFRLVRDPVRIADLAAISINIPMFEAKTLAIDKTSDKERAEIGDVVTYTINIHNPTAAPISHLAVTDRLPESFHYAPGSALARKDVSAVMIALTPQPTELNGALVFNLGEIAPAGSIQIRYRVRIGANARQGEQVNLAIATGIFSNGEIVSTAAARASVYLGAGVFSTRQIILGRVYEDVNHNNRFDKEDKPIVGARVYLMNGNYVLTDSAGLYSFPAVGDGANVIALDPVGLPRGLRLSDNGQVSGRSWARLLRTPLGGGALLHQDFALIRVDGKSTETVIGLSQAFVSGAAKKSPEKKAETEIPTPGPKPPAVSLGAGTYSTTSTEKIDPVKPGEALVINPTANPVYLSSSTGVQVRVALGWKASLELNGKQISDKNIGETRIDQANQITTYTFVGLTLRPGPNQVRVTPIGPNKEPGVTTELKLMGRGPATRIEIIPERNELMAGGQDVVIATIHAYDQWENPALDGSVAVEATNAKVMPIDEKTQSAATAPVAFSKIPSLDGNAGSLQNQPAAVVQASELKSQMVTPLRDGAARVKLVAPGSAGTAHLKAIMLNVVGETDLRVAAQTRPTILVGLAEASFGNVPELGLRGATGNYDSRISFFLRTAIKENMLTLSYDNLRPLNRAGGQDRLFQLDPLERAYPVFGDSSTRFEDAQSNSRLYARLDHKRSYAMFGDFDPDMTGLTLTGYTRKLTGVKLHAEDNSGSFITLTGARPNTAFARDVFPGGSLSLIKLSYGTILPGSEAVTLEVRDRRNPEIILSSELLIRSVDYNLDAITGELVFLRFVSAFDYSLNLTQIVVTYEHGGAGLNSMVMTGRAVKKFSERGLTIGVSGISQKQDQFEAFRLAGIDIEKRLPNSGLLKVATAFSSGAVMGFGANGPSLTQDTNPSGFAYDIDYNQPIHFREGLLHARLVNASAGFLNPFGATVVPGSRRGEVAFSLKTRASSILKFGFTNEQNKTANVDNARSTVSINWIEAVSERLKLSFGYDFKNLSDTKNSHDIQSNLVTIGADWKPTDKLQVSAKREQNLGSSDPTYPNQTTLGVNYQINDWAKLFFTQRLASAPIIPIADTTGTGFGVSSTRSETAVGIETKLYRFTSLTSRYQISDGVSGTDSFAVIGLVNRLPVEKNLSLELGFEHGFLLTGSGKSFDGITLGTAWQPKENFIGNVRYELRDRNGLEHLFVVGAAGRINENITALSRVQVSRTNSGTEQTGSIQGEVALAIRPKASDRMGLLFSYSRRSLETTGSTSLGTTRDRLDTLSTDAFYELTPRLEFSVRLAARFSANGQDQTPFVSTLTYLTQGRLQYRFARQFDLATEMRAISQASSGTATKSYGAELGYWALPELRLGGGYNFASAVEPNGSVIGGMRRGFYFTISTKLSNLFDLFGASGKELTTGAEQARTTGPQRPSELKETPK